MILFTTGRPNKLNRINETLKNAKHIYTCIYIYIEREREIRNNLAGLREPGVEVGFVSPVG